MPYLGARAVVPGGASRSPRDTDRPPRSGVSPSKSTHGDPGEHTIQRFRVTRDSVLRAHIGARAAEATSTRSDPTMPGPTAEDTRPVAKGSKRVGGCLEGAPSRRGPQEPSPGQFANRSGWPGYSRGATGAGRWRRTGPVAVERQRWEL